MRQKLTFLIFLVCSITSFASQVNWTFKFVGDGTDSPSVIITADIEKGFHLYALDNPAGGASALNIHFDLKGCETVGQPVPDKKYQISYDDIFEVDEHYYTDQVTFTQKLKPTSSKYTVEVEVDGQVCNDQSCFQVFGSKSFQGAAPFITDKQDKATITDPKVEISENKESISDSIATALDSLQSNAGPLTPHTVTTGIGGSAWDNIEAELKVFSDDPGQQERSLWYIFIAGFLGGLIALLTPCVWPMIPTTVSFFLKKSGSKSKSIRQALIYGLSIIVIYVGLGLIVTAIFGASALNELATSAIFNILFFLLLLVFAASFMGGFELELPSSWTNKIDAKVDSTTGMLSIFFMAFTLALVSFSCTGPIIGTLLVEAAATSNFVSPAVGMGGFAIALALPFTLFAIFPGMLKSRPKAGGWMNTVKVVLGFLELALALKFLSVADLAYGWRILDREVFISLWIVIFALLGVYLLGKISFSNDAPVKNIGVGRFALAVISLSFAIYMIPGLWGAPLKAISAFTPPVTTQDFSLYDGNVEPQTNDYDEALEMSARTGKPVLVDFSGFGCVNCRKMEAAVWTDPEIKDIIDRNYILVSLMVDDKTPLAEPIKVTESDGQKRTLRTVGDKWSYLERSKFGANAQPYYVVVDKDGKPLSGTYGYNEDKAKYRKFLNGPLK